MDGIKKIGGHEISWDCGDSYGSHHGAHTVGFIFVNLFFVLYCIMCFLNFYSCVVGVLTKKFCIVFTFFLITFFKSGVLMAILLEMEEPLISFEFYGDLLGAERNISDMPTKFFFFSFFSFFFFHSFLTKNLQQQITVIQKPFAQA